MLWDIPKLNSFIVVLKYCQKQCICCLIFINKPIMSEIGFSWGVLYRTGDAARWLFLWLKFSYLYNLANLQGNSEDLIRTDFSFRTHCLWNYELDLPIQISLIYLCNNKYMELYKTNKHLYKNSDWIRYNFVFLY